MCGYGGLNLKILIDASPLNNYRAGIGFYTSSLITYLAELDKNNKVHLYGRLTEAKIAAIDKELDLRAKGVQYVMAKMPFKALYYPWRFSGLSLMDIGTPEADIYHGMNVLPLPSNRGKSIITIHDLYFLIRPEHTNFMTKLILPREARHAVRRCDAIIADSESTKRDIIENLGVDAEKVKVVYLAARPEFRVLSDAQILSAIRAKYTNNHPYILFLGTLEPRKNLVSLIQAFAMVKRTGNFPHKLILAGRRGWGYEDIFAEIERQNLSQEVIVPDYVENADIVGLYNAAELFVYPSLYEGFGLPVLEAMACGTPVITTNISSLPEVAGDAGVLVAPDDVGGLAQAMVRVISDQEYSSELRNKGLEQVKKFSWNKTAKETFRVYQQVLNK